MNGFANEADAHVLGEHKFLDCLCDFGRRLMAAVQSEHKRSPAPVAHEIAAAAKKSDDDDDADDEDGDVDPLSDKTDESRTFKVRLSSFPVSNTTTTSTTTTTTTTSVSTATTTESASRVPTSISDDDSNLSKLLDVLMTMYARQMTSMLTSAAASSPAARIDGMTSTVRTLAHVFARAQRSEKLRALTYLQTALSAVCMRKLWRTAVMVAVNIGWYAVAE
jgi:hypothetical protein